MPDGSTKRKHYEEARQVRFARIERAEGTEQAYQASLSSELPVERWFGVEILQHTPEAVNMERAGRGLPLLFNHNPDEPIGRVQDIRVDAGRLRGTLVFSPNSPVAQRVKADVDGGFLGDISIAYSIDEYVTTTDDRDADTVTVTRWTPLEASIVTVPADHTVGVGRNRTASGVPKEGAHMSKPNAAGDGQETGGGAGSVDVAQVRSSVAAAAANAATTAVKAERERIAQITDMFELQRFTGPAFSELRERCIREGVSVDQARIALIQLMDAEAPLQTPTTVAVPDAHNAGSRAQAPAGGFQRQPLVQAGADGTEKALNGAERAIELRAGLLSKEDVAKESTNEFRGLTLVEVGRLLAQRQGLQVAGLDKRALVALLFTQRRDVAGLGNADFPGILANVATKGMLRGWEETPATWSAWCRVGSLPDFKRANRTGLSGVDLLDEVGENAEFKYGATRDRTEYNTLKTYGKLFKITRQAIINDDLGAFTAIPRKMGSAAARTLNKAVYDLLTTASGVGPTLNHTSRALFNSTDANYDATSGSITVANLDVARQKMRLQKDPQNNEPLNIVPRILLVPAALETTANVLIASQNDPVFAGGTGGNTAPNPFQNALTVVAEPTLDGKTNGTTAWYVIGDPNQYDTFEVAFLDGQQNPMMEQQDAWTIDGTSFKVRHDFGVAALDFRAMYRKRGA